MKGEKTMNDEVSAWVRESQTLRTEADRRSFIERHMGSSVFMGLVQHTYSMLHWHDQAAGQDGALKEDRMLDHVPFKGMQVSTFLSTMEKERSTFGTRSGEIYSRYVRENPDVKEAVDGVLSRSLFGLSADLLNECAGFQWLPSLRFPEQGRFRADLFKDASEWYSFKRKEGGMAAVLRHGRTCEVLSRSGRQYLMLDGLRKAFARVPFDGVFMIQLSFAGEDGLPDRRKFFVETARNVQSDSWLADVFDWGPVTAMRDGSDVPWEERRSLALLGVRQAGDPRITYCSATRCSTSPVPGEFVIRRDARFNDVKAKDFMLVQEAEG